MKRFAKITLELTGMAILLVSLCVIAFISMHFLNKATIAKRQPDTFTRLIKNEDVQVDKSGSVRYRGKLLGKLHELGKEPQPKELPKLPNGALGPSTLYLGKGSWLISGGNFKSKSKNDLLIIRPSTENYLFEEGARHFRQLPALSKGRWGHSLLKLANGNVLVFGGILPEGHEATIELLDMKRNSCSSIGLSAEGRIQASLLEVAPNCVLAAGGRDPDTSIVEVISVDSSSCKTMGHLNKPRWGASMFQTPDKDYLVVGGFNSLSESDSNHLPPELISVSAGKP